MAATSPPRELLGPDLGPEEGSPCDLTRAQDFARHVLGPAGTLVDRLAPDELTVAGPLVSALLVQAGREGLTRLDAPCALGVLRRSARDEALMIEALATADAGLTAVLVAAPTPFRWAATAGPSSLAAAVAQPYFFGERPDWIGCCASGPDTIPLRARPCPGGWSLSGETGAVAGAAVATHALVACTVDGLRAGTALVPLAGRGVTRHAAPSGTGLRGLSRARLAFDDVRLGVDHVVIAPAGHRPRLPDARAQAASALVAVGVGRAAYEGALRWAREGAWAGDPHAARAHVRPRLLRMFTVLEATRVLAHAAYRAAGADAGPLETEIAALEQARAGCAFAVGAALEVAEAAARLCGSGPVVFLDGSTFDPSKLLRDAQATRH